MLRRERLSLTPDDASGAGPGSHGYLARWVRVGLSAVPALTVAGQGRRPAVPPDRERGNHQDGDRYREAGADLALNHRAGRLGEIAEQAVADTPR